MKNCADTSFQYAQNVCGHRLQDPETSRIASKNVAFRKNSQLAKLLNEYYEKYNSQEFPTIGMTDEEAGLHSGLIKKPRCCYWKRCSELRKGGLIKPNGEKRESSANELQAVCIITEKGIDVAKKLIDS